MGLTGALLSMVLLVPPAPISAQVPVIKKLLQFEHGWAEGRTVLVVTKGPDDPQALDALQEFKANGVAARVVEFSELAPADDVAALYISRSLAAEKVSAFARENHYLTISWKPDDVEEGNASCAVGRGSTDKPEILVNLTSLKAEERGFSDRVLQIAQVIP
jgi:YfiR/HmsC-like